MNSQKTMKEVKIHVLRWLTEIPLISTKEVALFFAGRYQNPEKRASELLLSLEKDRVIQGVRLKINQSKLWRLTHHAKIAFGARYRTLSFTSPKTEHALLIGHFWKIFYLRSLVAKDLSFSFFYEPMFVLDEHTLYCPDAHVIWNTGGQVRNCFLEVQKTPLSQERWGKKWYVAERFFSSQTKQPIIVLSNSPTSIVQSGSKLPIFVCKDFHDIERLIFGSDD